MSDYEISSTNLIDLSGIQYKPKKNLINNKKVSEKQPVSKVYNPEIEKEYIQKIAQKKMTVSKPIVKKNTVKKDVADTVEEEKNRIRLKLNVEMYLNEFPEKLNTFKAIKLEKQSVGELSDILKQINFTLANKSVVKGGVQLITGGIQAYEFFLVNFTPINATGITKMCCSDPDVLDDIKHITLKHCNLTSTEPEQRLLFKLLTTTWALHNLNGPFQGESSDSIQANTIKNDESIKKINEEYTDI